MPQCYVHYVNLPQYIKWCLGRQLWTNSLTQYYKHMYVLYKCVMSCYWSKNGKGFLTSLKTGWKLCQCFRQNALVFFRAKMEASHEHILQYLFQRMFSVSPWHAWGSSAGITRSVRKVQFGSGSWFPQSSHSASGANNDTSLVTIQSFKRPTGNSMGQSSLAAKNLPTWTHQTATCSSVFRWRPPTYVLVYFQGEFCVLCSSESILLCTLLVTNWIPPIVAECWIALPLWQNITVMWQI